MKREKRPRFESERILRLHPVLLVQEPPARAELHLARHRPVLEVAGHGCHQLVVARVQVVEDRSREPPLAVEAVEEPRQRSRHLEVADRVGAAVGAQQVPQARRGVSKRAQVVLLHPAAVVVHEGEPVQQRRPIARGRPGIGDPPRAHGVEGCRHLGVGPGLGLHPLEAVVGRPAPRVVEGGVAAVQGLEELRERGDRAVGGSLEAAQPGVAGGGVVDRQRGVGAPAREHPRAGIRVGREREVVLERVGRVVGRDDEGHLELAEQAAGREVGVAEALVAAVEGRAGGVGREQPHDAERSPQLHVGPVVERVAQRPRDGGGPRLELLPVGGGTGDEALGHAVGTHRPPLVVVALEPRLGDRPEGTVGRDAGDRQVAVIVDDRQGRGDAVEEVAGGVRAEQEVVVDEGRHGLSDHRN